MQSEHAMSLSEQHLMLSHAPSWLSGLPFMLNEHATLQGELATTEPRLENFPFSIIQLEGEVKS